MAIVKILSPSGWDFDGSIATIIKVANSGLVRGYDRQQFIKRAGATSNIFLPYLDGIKIARDEVPIHLIALGACEAYGPNRNGDAFREAILKQAHDTFVKYARFYRNHKNKDNPPSYGYVKLSAYNPVMRRVELLCMLNAEKSAADRNGGFLADKELEKLSRDEDIPVSMACRVPYDECSYCHNRARSRDEYCTASMCKAGGCKENLTRLVKVAGDAHMLHVDNHSPAFFDISHVYRPADRTAWGSRADYLTKAAGDHGFFGTDGAKLAEDMGVHAPLSVILSQEQMLPGQWNGYMVEQIKLAHGMASLQKQAGHRMHAETQRAFLPDMQPDIDFSVLDMDVADLTKTAAALGALADQKIVLSLRDFARLTKRAEHLEPATLAMHGVYSRMIGDGSLERRLTDNKFAPAEKLASAKQRETARRMVSTYSLQKEAVDTRCQLSALRQHRLPSAKSGSWSEKQAADNRLAEDLARDYACYKVAALHRIAQFDQEFLLTARLAECQNHVV
jgi:hypothetical protein